MTSSRSLYCEARLVELKENLKLLSKRVESYAVHEKEGRTTMMQDYYLLCNQLNQVANNLESLSLPSFTLRNARAGLVEETDLHLGKLNALYANFPDVQTLQDMFSSSNDRRHFRENSRNPATREPQSWSREPLGSRTTCILADAYKAEVDYLMGLRMEQKRRNSKLSRFKQFCSVNSKSEPHHLPQYPLVDTTYTDKSSSQPPHETRSNRLGVSRRATYHEKNGKHDPRFMMSDEPTSPHTSPGLLRSSSLPNTPYEPRSSRSPPDRDDSDSDKSRRSRYFLPTPTTSLIGSRRGSVKDFFSRSPRPYFLPSRAGYLRRSSSSAPAFGPTSARRASTLSPRLIHRSVHPFIGCTVPESTRTSGTARYHTALNSERTTYNPPSIADEKPRPELSLRKRSPGIQNISDKGTTYKALTLDSSPCNCRETSRSTQPSGFLYPSLMDAQGFSTTAGRTCAAPASKEVKADPAFTGAVDESAKMLQEELRDFFFKELLEFPEIRPCAPSKMPIEKDLEHNIIDVHPHLRSKNMPSWHEHRSKTHRSFNTVAKSFSADSSAEGPVLGTKYPESLEHVGNGKSRIEKHRSNDVLENYWCSSQSATARHKHRPRPAHSHSKYVPEHQTKGRHSPHVGIISGRSERIPTQMSPSLEEFVDSQDKYRYSSESAGRQRADDDTYIYYNDPHHLVHRNSGAVAYSESIRSNRRAVYTSGEDKTQERKRTESVQNQKSERSRNRRDTQNLRTGSNICTRRGDKRVEKRTIDGWTRKRGKRGCVLM